MCLVSCYLCLHLSLSIISLFYKVFKVSATSPPMPCFIMCAQIAVLAVDYHSHFPLKSVIFDKSYDLRLDMKIVLTMYGILNLDFFHYDILPPQCLSTKIRFFDLAVLQYVSAFYPIFLIVPTYLCVQLHDRNFRLLVLIWRPFHKCFVRVRREWNAKNDLIDVFITFFVVSYNS